MIETLKASGTEGRFFSRWAGMHVNAVEAQQSLGVLTALLNVVPPLLASLSAVVILGFGGFRVLEGVLTIGGLIAFQSLAQSFAQPIQQMVQFSANLQTVKADISRLDDVHNHQLDEYDYDIAETRVDRGEPKMPPVLGRSLRIENVTFGYNAKEPPLIENFNLTIEPGQRVAIVGPSGSGKSTLSLLVAGVWQPWSGEVRFDGHLRSEIPREVLVGSVAMVDQNIVLFAGTVNDNLTLWNPTIPDHAVVAAARDAVIHDEIVSRPLGYASRVAENGHNFSGGQRQRLEIARALVNTPSVLILDEATSALDAVNELKVDDAVRRRGCTSLIVAHRLSTIRDSDLIVVLNEGKEVQRGTHEELMAIGTGLYHELIRSA